MKSKRLEKEEMIFMKHSEDALPKGGIVPLPAVIDTSNGQASPESVRPADGEDGQGFKFALHLQHNVVNIIYTITNMIHNYFNRYGQNGAKDPDHALKEAQAILKKISDLTGRAYEITRRVSLAMRAQRIEDEPLELVSVKEVWRDVLEILRKRYSFWSIEIIEHIPDEFPLIECKQSELFEILYYLAQNAIQAMRRKGKMIIRTNREFKTGEKASAVITLSDTGPGIPETVLTQLFEPFFSTKPLNEGNGRGLCLVRSLVKRNRGSVSVSSFEGCGTTFTLSFGVGRVKRPESQAECAIAG